MEELRRRRRIADLDVVFRGHLQPALDARARMLGPGPLVAMRKEEDDAREPEPLVLRRGNELVDDDLTGVCEVSELRLPHDERVGSVEAVPVVEAEHPRLGEGAVPDLESALRRIGTA